MLLSENNSIRFPVTVQRKSSVNWEGSLYCRMVEENSKNGNNVVGTDTNMKNRTAIQYAIDIFLSEEKRKA